MGLEHLLVAVQGKLLATHGADLPVALYVLLELVLIVVGREDDLAERAALHVHAAETGEGGVSSEVMSAHTNKEHLSDASWVAPLLDGSRTNTSHMLQHTPAAADPGAINEALRYLGSKQKAV